MWSQWQTFNNSMNMFDSFMRKYAGNANAILMDLIACPVCGIKFYVAKQAHVCSCECGAVLARKVPDKEGN